GMGLERIAAVLQHVHSNYEIDLFTNLIEAAAKETACKDFTSSSLKVIADHIRSCAFLIADGVLPSNEGRGYVLRRIIRRAARHGHKLGASEPFFYKLVKPLADEMGEAYPELREKQQAIEGALLAEEQKFNATLASGMQILDEDLNGLKGAVIPGEVLFKLYDTFGFPVDLTADIARERGLEIDLPGFEAAMEEQRQRARAANQFASDMSSRITVDQETRFTGYDNLADTARVTDLFIEGKPVKSVTAGQNAIVVLDHTPFYGESGGQLGDTGTLTSKQSVFEVEDTQKSGSAVTHSGLLKQGQLNIGDTVEAKIDADRRRRIVQNHSATHLLHAALRNILGSHVAQKGSLVGPDYLRFDFSHGAPVSSDELIEIERWVNQRIAANQMAVVESMSMENAVAKGAIALFGEKYGDVVRVISLGDDSTELCGGTHVSSTGDIGLFRIIGETGVASGIRRIEASSGMTALNAALEDRSRLSALSKMLKTPQSELENKVSGLLDNLKKQQREFEKLQLKLTANAGDAGLDQVQEIAGVKVLCLKFEEVDAKALREMIDRFRDKLGNSIVVLASVTEGKVQLAAGVSKPLTDRVNAGQLINAIAGYVGGKGGGRPDMAMAGGDEPTGVDKALASVPEWLQDKLA
ncbi:MAG: alanine--tRNA ligase, partial [Gammaproteobacteria bacterium]|nr:alanine--tRNA ligase [Gammaproteobacteria bacterium]